MFRLQVVQVLLFFGCLVSGVALLDHPELLPTLSSASARNNNEVCVVGGGFIGSAFCAVFLAVGKRVVCSDPYVDDETVKRRIEEIWPNLRARGLTGIGQASPPFRRLCFEPNLEKAVQGVSFVQECCVENIGIKQHILGQVDSFADRSVIIASSTSFIPHELLIKKCRHHPDRVLIGHPSIPHLDCFMEIYGTSPSWVQFTKDWYKQSGFDVIVMKRTIPGHVLNSFLTMNMRHGAKLVRDGVCSPEDVNTSLRHLGRDFYARNSFLCLLSAVGGDRGLQGGLDLSAKIKDSAISIVFYSLMKKIWMPDIVANAVGNLMSKCLGGLIEPPPPAEVIDACKEMESRMTKGGKLSIQSGLFRSSAKMYNRIPYESGNDAFGV